MHSFPNKGIYPVLYALFQRDGDLDRAAMKRQVEICIEQGADAIVTLGLATEVRSLSMGQRRQLVEWISEDIKGRCPHIVTIFEPTPGEQVEAVGHARSMGADLVILQPSLSSTDSQKLFADFETVLSQIDMPAALQNVPQFLGVGLDLEEIVGLSARYENLISIKQEVSATETMDLVSRVGSKMKVISGRGGIELIDGFHAGVHGHIPAPEYLEHVISLWKSLEKGDEAEARRIYSRYLPVATFILQSVSALTTYGKLMFCLRHELPYHPRPGASRPTEFGVAALLGHMRFLGIEMRMTDPKVKAVLS